MKKVVIITGASRGFGELIAKNFKRKFSSYCHNENIDNSKFEKVKKY